MEKSIIILLQDDKNWRNSVKTALSSDDGPEIIACATSEEWQKALKEHAGHIRCMIMDEAIREDCRTIYSSALIAALRNGTYGDAIKTTPALLVSGGERPVLDVDDMTCFIPQPVRLSQIEGYIADPFAKIPETQQVSRDHNAQILVGWLTNRVEGHSMQQMHSWGATRHGEDRSVLATMRHHFMQAFTFGLPDQQHMWDMRVMALKNRIAAPPESAALNLEQQRLFTEIEARVNKELGPLPKVPGALNK